MVDTVNSVDPFQAAAVSRLAADEREFKAKLLAGFAELSNLVRELHAKIEKLEPKKLSKDKE